MSLRLRLALTFFLLSAVPLAAIVLTSYFTSRRALHEAARAEAELQAREVEVRVAAAAEGLGRQLERLRELPAEAWASDGRDGTSEPLAAALFVRLREALPFLDQLEFVPAPPAPAPPAAPEARPSRSPEPAAPARAVAPAIPWPAPPAGAGVTTGDVTAQLDRVRAEIARALGERARARVTLSPVEARGLAEAGRALAELVHGGRAREARAPRLTRGEVTCDLRSGEEVVGELRARVREHELLRTALAATRTDQGEIPFAVDGERRIVAVNAEQAARLRELPGIASGPDGEVPAAGSLHWVVVTRQDPATGLRFGIARPLAEPLAALRRATARNLAWGLGLVGVALIGVFPLAGRMTRHLDALAAGAERLAAGDLDTRVPVRSRDEIGRLAAAFNRMAGELRQHQEQLLDQEKRRKEEEIAHRLVAAENERKGRELEDARQFQLSLLPRHLPDLPGLEVAVAMRTAAEVGGDYYDVQAAPEGGSVLAIGDATGHGVAAATMVTVVKSLFICEGAALSPAAFLARANGQVQRMGLARMAMALTVLRVAGRRIRLAAAGMPPALWWHAASGEVTEVDLAATPLGALAGATYEEREVELLPGDTLLLTSDGFPEQQGATGEPLGYDAARAHFAVAAGAGGDGAATLALLDRAVADWQAGRPLSDDVTFLLLRAT